MSAAHDVEALLAQLGAAPAVPVLNRHDAVCGALTDRLPGAAPAVPVLNRYDAVCRALTDRLLGTRVHLANATETAHSLALEWPELDELLPDGGLPRGVVELAATHGRGGATTVALAAVRAGQMRGKKAWCAWIDPEGTLHAPGVVAAGVALERMFVVRAPRAGLSRTALKVVATGAFEVVVIDLDSSLPRAEMLVRKLALAAEPSGSTVLLLTDSTLPRALPWPVCLRLELSRPDIRALSVRVAKDRRARVTSAKAILFRPVALLAG